jgi:hypothetical protein
MMVIMKILRLKVTPSKLYPDVDFKTCPHTCVSNLKFTHPRISTIFDKAFGRVT